MKKNLLALFSVGALISLNAQTALNTYIGDKAVVKVEANTLFYNGGNLSIASDVEKTVINEGNIHVTNAYTKVGAVPNDAGKEFVNVYTDPKAYGQLIIAGNNAMNTANTGYATVERASVDPSKVEYLNLGVPFQGNVADFTKIFGVNFRGNCAVDVACAQRYGSTMQKWNNGKIVWDAVPTASTYQPGHAYNLNIWNVNTKLKDKYATAYANGTAINYRGRVAPQGIDLEAVTLIVNYDEATFNDRTWGVWKNKINKYNEYYKTYVQTNGDDTSIIDGKNFHQYGNPYTSNIDLSNPDTYLKIDGQSPSSTDYLITITKQSPDSQIKWNEDDGTTFGNDYSAEQTSSSPSTWGKSREALLIRPFEKFTITVRSAINKKIVPVKLTFSDEIKTFVQDIPNALRSENAPANRSNSMTDFAQLEVFLTKENGEYLGNPIYLAASTAFDSNTIQYNDGLNNYSYFLQEDAETNTSIVNSETTFNTIHDNFVGKPVFLGLTNDVAEADYAFKFKLYDESIFGNVETNLANGRKFYLEDRKNGQVTEIKNNQEYTFNLANGDDLQNRFAVYWKEYKKLGTGEEELNKYKTLVYKNDNYDYFTRLNSAKKSATIEIYNLQGQKVDDYRNVPTTSDFKLANLTTPGVYIVKVTYVDGENFTTKVIVK